jgi:uncharacterized circularly permuted ATP-grasp superfamily protein/uncharacterized alpha-E superfamily protein
MVASINQESLFQHYFSSNYSYDELLGGDGKLRPHWQTFFDSFSKLKKDELLDRNQDLLRLLKENGVTYNIYGEPDGMNRPWNVDPIPFLISKNEWQVIESGLVQRTELFDFILKDIYGERRLIKEGLLPLELIYNHTGFLRQCCGIKLPGKHSLIVSSADMARSPDGKIWIMNDRTQAPSGSGYAIENRTAMARVLPELFDGIKVRRLSPYFNALRNALHDIAPGQRQNIRIVILTPGPSNETYFEHSYLSSYLGFTLVQGDDLMVKDNYVWLKTLGGLEKVDVILRRVDDVYCDPLELKSDSQLGIPGLLQVVRSGNVSIANPLGSSILENPGLMPFLQNISRMYFNQDLIMPSIASWWCGQPRELSYVLANISSLVIRRIYRESSIGSSIDGASLTSFQLSELKAQIKAHPYLYVGQEKVSFSSIPSLVNGKIEPRKAVFRSFVVSHNTSYVAMAGGLTRTSTDIGDFIISNQLGGISKDTWIISPEPGRVLNVQKEIEPNIQVFTTSGMLPSRTAENLFWVGRYAERLLGNARFMRTVIQFISEGNRLLSEHDIQTEQALLKALTAYSYTYPGFIGDQSMAKLADPMRELIDMLFNESRAGSLSNNFQCFSRSVNSVRDHWSTDTWRVLRGMEEEWRDISSSVHPNYLRMLTALDGFITSMVAFVGLNRESISREQGWTILDAGRKIEQCLLLINILRSCFIHKQDDQTEFNMLEALLRSNESLVNYRYKYRSRIKLNLVLDLMVLDPNNPRSLVYQMDRIKAYITDLPKLNAGHELTEQERLILEAYTLLKLTDKDKLAELDFSVNNRYNLSNFLFNIENLLGAIPGVITKNYFKHTQTQKQLFISDIQN